MKIRIMSISICFCYTLSFRFIFFFSLNPGHVFTYEMPLANFEQVKLAFTFYRSNIIASISMSRTICVIISAIPLSTCTPSQSIIPVETTQYQDSRILDYYNM